MNNIAITGKMRAGKTTLANILVDQYGYEKMSLAEPLKALGKELLEGVLTELDYLATDIGHNTRYIRKLSDERLEQDKAVFRAFWQWLGTDFCRNYIGWETLWVDIILYRIQNATKPVVIDDVRFLNEAQALRERGFMVVRVIRIGENNDASTVSGVDGHVSETEVDSIIPDSTITCDNVVGLRWAAAELVGLTPAVGARRSCAGAG